MGCDSLTRAPLPGSRETWEEVLTLSSQVHPYSTFLTDKGCAPARPALQVWKPSQPPLSLIHAFLRILFIVLWTCDAGRAGAHPYHATRADHRRMPPIAFRS